MKKGPQKGVERELIARMPVGYSFYTDKLDKYMAAIASIEGRKITTERGCFLSGPTSGPNVKPLVKVTIIS